MRLILANPHVHFYAKTVRNALIHNPHITKYAFVRDYYLKNKTKDVGILLDGTRSSLNELGVRFTYLGRIFTYVEYVLWCLLNGLNPLQCKVYFGVGALDPKHDIILNFAHTSLDEFPRNTEVNTFHQYSGLVFTHLTHYFRSTEKIAENVRRIKHNILVAENNLVSNGYFRYFFPEEKQVYHLPFSFPSRFKKRKPFAKRVNKCFAVGTTSRVGPEYERFFGKDPSIHPMRNLIYQKRNEVTPWIDSYISDFDDVRRISQIQSQDSALARWAKKHLPHILLTKLFPNHLTRYFQFDIVEKYNDYRMFVSPEEACGLPSVNAIEGMACGTALVAIDDLMYTALGLVPGVHYITYKQNDLDDLLKIVEYYQAHPQELQRIADAGCTFVREHFNPEAVAQIFWKDLEYFSNVFSRGKRVFRCSFVR
ncbi:MAG: glycosyltransferase [Candidatus Andersenbacteria bacterium]